MQDGEKLSLQQIRVFLEASEEVQFEGQRRQEVYECITQVTRLIGRYVEHSEVKESSHCRHRFASRFTPADLELPAQVDEAHETLSRPATKKILEREWEIYQHAEYERLATISVARIYNLRRRPRYRQRRMNYAKREPCRWPSGSGVSRNQKAARATSESTRCIQETGTESRGCITSTRSTKSRRGRWWDPFRPSRRRIWSRFYGRSCNNSPFPVRGFHSDNGSEFINDTVTGLLKDFADRADQIAPAPQQRQWPDGIEKGAVIRKHMGYGYAAAHAEDIGRFYQRHFNPYLNFHRPCGRPERIVYERGKEKYVYGRYAKPWKTLRELSRAWPRGMQEAKRKLFLTFRQERKSA